MARSQRLLASTLLLSALSQSVTCYSSGSFQTFGKAVDLHLTKRATLPVNKHPRRSRHHHRSLPKLTSRDEAAADNETEADDEPRYDKTTWIYPILNLTQSPLSLAVNPTCGSLAAPVPVNANDGIDVESITTVVSFGDSYTSTGWNDGRPGDTPIVRPPWALAGTQDPYYGGRMSNGLVWVEWLRQLLPEQPVLRDFAVSGAVTNISLFPGDLDWHDRPASDFMQQLDIYANQPIADANSTLYTVYFGINDYLQNPAQFPNSATSMINSLIRLQEPPFNARNILLMGLQYPSGMQYRQTIFDALTSFSEKYGTKFAWSDMLNFFSAISASPGTFGLKSLANCVSDYNEAVPGEICEDPNTTFFWVKNHPSTTSALLIAQWTYQVLLTCT